MHASNAADGRLAQGHSILTCPGCGTTIRVNPDKLIESVEAMEQAFERQPRSVQIEP